MPAIDYSRIIFSNNRREIGSIIFGGFKLLYRAALSVMRIYARCIIYMKIERGFSIERVSSEQEVQRLAPLKSRLLCN